MGTRTRSGLNAFLMLLGFMIVGPVISILVSKLKLADDRFFFDEPALAIFLLVPVLLLVTVTLLLKWREESWRSIGLYRPDDWKNTFFITILILLADAAIILFIGPLIFDLLGEQIDTSSFEPVAGNLPGLIGMTIFAWVMGGVAEEIVFRGYLMTNLAFAFGGEARSWWLAAVVQSLLFSLPHLYQGPAGAIQTGLLGFISAIFFMRCGRNLLPLILAHGIVNSIIFAGFYFGISFQELGL